MVLLAIAATIEELKLQSFVAAKCTFATANADLHLLTQLQTQTCINFASTALLFLAANKNFAATFDFWRRKKSSGSCATRLESTLQRQSCLAFLQLQKKKSLQISSCKGDLFVSTSSPLSCSRRYVGLQNRAAVLPLRNWACRPQTASWYFAAANVKLSLQCAHLQLCKSVIVAERRVRCGNVFFADASLGLCPFWPPVIRWTLLL